MYLTWIREQNGTAVPYYAHNGDRTWQRYDRHRDVQSDPKGFSEGIATFNFLLKKGYAVVEQSRFAVASESKN